MRRRGWSTRSSLWFVLLVALGLKAAIGTWSSGKRGSVEYHRGLAARCDGMSTRYERWAARIRAESSEKALFDPAAAAEDLQHATWFDADARSYSLLAASLAAKAESCEQSPAGWLLLLCDTVRHPPDLPVRHSTPSGRGRPWVEQGTLPYYILVTLVHVDFLGLACLALAIVTRRWFTPARGVVGDPDRRVASASGVL